MDSIVAVAETPGLVSVLMPAYNAGHHIGRSIASVQAQHYPQWELLVIDDGSTDDTRAVVQDYARHDARVRYLYQPNGRQGRARNNGLAHAAGQYVAFLDSDDLWLPEKLTVQLRDLAATQADAVFCDAYLFADAFDPAAGHARIGTQRATYQGEEGVGLFLAANRVPILTVLCRRAAIVQAGGFVENRPIQNAEDYHLWLLLLLNGCRLEGFDYALAAYRQHTASVSDPDGLNLRQVVEAKVDLAARYPARRAAIEASIQASVRHSLAHLAALPPPQAFAALERYLHVLGKQRYQPLLAGLRRLGSVPLAIRATYFVFNYL